MIKYLIVSTYNHLSFKLFEIVSYNQIILISLILLFLGLIVFLLLKRNNKKILFKGVIAISFSISLCIVLYLRGKEINDLFICGYNIVTCLENYYSSNNSYPKSLNEIANTNCMFCKTEYILLNYRYKYNNVEDINKELKEKKENKLKEKDSYSLDIISKMFYDEYYFYNHKSKKFILTD